jgi:amidohydrolase
MKTDALNRDLEKCRDQLIGWRRHFHEYPELETECHRTAEVVAEHLRKIGLQVTTGVAKTGVVAVLRGRQEGPVVALRVDMDALPIQEQTGLPFSSKLQGAMHACGHDGHTAMGLGVATVLAGLRELLPGTVKFIFQPGEESPGAARIMINEGVLENPKVDAILGCHIFPGVPSGKVGIRYGTMCAACDQFDIHIKGVGGHGAYPHQCKDPIVAAASLVASVQTIVSRLNDPVQPLVISICKIRGGDAHNVIPDRVILGGTIRSIDERARETAHRGVKDIVKGIEVAYGVKTELEILPIDPPLRCNEHMVAFVEERVGQLLGSEKVVRIPSPSLGADDFASFSEQVPAAYVRIGCYNQEKGYVHGLHTPCFDFDENLLVDGSRVLSFLIGEFLSTDLRL